MVLRIGEICKLHLTPCSKVFDYLLNRPRQAGIVGTYHIVNMLRARPREVYKIGQN